METDRDSNSERLRIAWLKSGPLHPIDTGGKIRTYGMLNELRKGHHVTYMALATPAQLAEPEIVGAEAAGEYSHEQVWIPWTEARGLSPRLLWEVSLNTFASSLPFVIQKYRSKEMARRISEIDRGGEFDLIVCDFVSPAINLPPGSTSTPIVLFQHNVEAQIWRRLFETKRNPLARAYFRSQYRRMKRYEAECCRRFDGVIAVSEEDEGLFRSDYALENVIGSVSTGVDLARFSEAAEARDRSTILFLGSMDWMPNIDAVGYFFDEILPRFRASGGEHEIVIVGRNPPADLSRRVEAMPGVTVTGTVPEVTPYLAQASLMVVPLRVGGGTRLKIFEAMAAKVAVVSTAIGAEGLALEDGREIAIADGADEFARAMSELLASEPRRLAMAEAAFELVAANYSWASVTREFVLHLRQALQRGTRSRRA